MSCSTPIWFAASQQVWRGISGEAMRRRVLSTIERIKLAPKFIVYFHAIQWNCQQSGKREQKKKNEKENFRSWLGCRRPSLVGNYFVLPCFVENSLRLVENWCAQIGMSCIQLNACRRAEWTRTFANFTQYAFNTRMETKKKQKDEKVEGKKRWRRKIVQ